ncbi:alpha-hydroxy-acid oxidizing protein [Desulfosporosinus sp. BICA1-9]|uniref:alpha-hydroxy-acid oxidizing protein n=1 Tax=Desulfosporosinus sp. BICA1-9 TaxID=1531958 RepID=UPI00054BA41D|nr:alpha-hydroxy-acid oxidizing protein [Desulfosporosinus sp. BICA1-9]KJS50381.1 MAG: (S)-2-hydroxy-acid oxidase [Peptococcaceae bacterium BRH_c23]KJS89571.1 MAG: (S)-2-hydroxy-acid oxidase [Desulfosporosinus sp. BICA1-9]HBW34815.1 alpha-hydroxy-acid oxidizing protein [Desulfosporosinus sp.]
MNIKTVRQTAREKLKGYCRVCPECNGKACAGEVPGMGGMGTGASFKNNVEALAAFRINLRTMHSAKHPDTQIKLFGQELKTPILGAPIMGNNFNMGGALNEEEWAEAVIQGCLTSGTLGCTGDAPDPAMYFTGIDVIAKAQGRGIPIIKPREQDEVLNCLRRAEEAGALAVGMDVDTAGLVSMKVGPKSVEEMKAIISSTSLPFIIKGIMTVSEAEMALEVGASAIVVSNHGGRVLDHTPGTAEVLPEIAAVVDGRIPVIVDGGVRTGVDVLKMLALGADAVMIGRPLIIAGYGGGADGVALVLRRITNELKQAMLLTGCATLSDINIDVLF